MSLERKNTDFGTRPAAMTVAPRTGLMSGAPAGMAPGRAIEMQERAAPVRQQPQPVSVGEVVPGMPVAQAFAMQPQPGQARQPTTIAQQMPPPRMGRWSSELFACSSDTTICLSGLFCPCVLLGQLHEKNGSEGCCVKVVSIAIALEVFAYVCLFYGLSIAGYHAFRMGEFVYWIFLAIMTAQIKKKIAQRDRIPSDDCQDCLAIWFCLRCSVCQMGRHEYPQSHAGSGTYEFASRNGGYSPRAPVVTV